MTLVGDRVGVIPVDTTQRVMCLVCNPSGTIFYNLSNTYFTNELKYFLPNVSIRTVSTSIGSSQRAQIISDATTNFDRVILATYDWVSVYSSNQRTLIQQLCQIETPVIFVSFGSPYPLIQFSPINTFLCGYCSETDEQQFAADAICGAYTPTGKVPVNVYWTSIDPKSWNKYW